MSRREISLADCCDLITDGDHQPPPQSDSGIPFISISDFTPYNTLSFERGNYVPETYYTSLPDHRKARKGDILYSVVGSFGIPILLRDHTAIAFHRNIALLRPKSTLDTEYLYYAMLSREFYQQADSVALGAAQRLISLTSLRNMKLSVPSIEEQRKIARVLSAYDTLIENNRKQIKLLEEAARRLYKEWFVDLRFPGHEHTPIVNGIPEGWRKTNIGEVCETVGGGTPSTKFEEYYSHGTIPWVTPTDITRNDCLFLLRPEKYITEEGLNKSSAKLVPPYTILMTSRASVGFFGLSRETVCTNQGFISCIPHDKAIHYYMLYNLMDRVDEIRAAAGGSTYLEIRKSDFRKFVFIVPSSHVLECFNQIVGSILKKMENLKHGIDHLTEARDRLLPKLMSGEITIK